MLANNTGQYVLRLTNWCCQYLENQARQSQPWLLINVSRKSHAGLAQYVFVIFGQKCPIFSTFMTYFLTKYKYQIYIKNIKKFENTGYFHKYLVFFNCAHRLPIIYSAVNIALSPERSEIASQTAALENIVSSPMIRLSLLFPSSFLHCGSRERTDTESMNSITVSLETGYHYLCQVWRWCNVLVAPSSNVACSCLWLYTGRWLVCCSRLHSQTSRRWTLLTRGRTHKPQSSLCLDRYQLHLLPHTCASPPLGWHTCNSYQHAVRPFLLLNIKL